MATLNRPRRDDPAQLTFFAPLPRLERAGVDTWRVVQDGTPVGWIRPSRLARALGVHVNTIYSWINSGVIPANKWKRRGPKIIYIHAGEAERLDDTSDK
ncbi:MAG: helix-turn-helix domain-containing protein [Opitutaceae bacterium]|jgi:hypothetical protein|nr:helix-turn-helix domain-containing protein [Opitutaceae bacterium]